MFNKRVRGNYCLKFLDELVLPLVIVLAARYLGFFIATYLRPVQFSFGSRSDLISAPFLSFNYQADLLFSNSISWIFIATTLAVLFGFILFRNFYFHGDWIHPRDSARLHGRNMEFLITERKEAFYQAVSWLVLTIFLGILVFIEVLNSQLNAVAFGAIWSISTCLVLGFFLQLARDGKLRSKDI